MPKMVKIKAKKGLKVPYSMTRNFISDEQATEVPLTKYWSKRLTDGDVELVEEKKQETKSKNKSTKLED